MAFLDTPRESTSGAYSFGGLIPGNYVQFTRAAPSLTMGGAPASYALEAGVSPGTTIVSIPVTGTSYLAAGVPPGTYYVRVRGVNAAGAGAPSTEVTLTVTASGSSPLEPPTNLVAFMSGGLLTLTWAAPAAGGVPTGYIVEAGSATGLTNIASVPVTSRSFVFAPVPDGFYFVRVRAQNASGVSAPSLELMLVVGNVATPPGAPSFTSAQVNGSTVPLNWAAPASGTPTSYINRGGVRNGALEPRGGQHGVHGPECRLQRRAVGHLLRAPARGQRARRQRCLHRAHPDRALTQSLSSRAAVGQAKAVAL